MTAGLRYGTTDAQGLAKIQQLNSNYLTRAFFNLTGPLTVA